MVFGKKSGNPGNTVKLVYSDPHWDETNEVTVDRWSF